MRIFTFANIALLAVASIASAHGVQTQLIYNAAANRIDTRAIIATSSNPFGLPVPIHSITAQRRAYIEPLLLSPIGAGTGYYARPDPALTQGVPDHPTGPGPAYQYDDLLPGSGWAFNGSATLPNLAGTSFGYKFLDGLKAWDGASFVDPGIEQAQIISGDGTTSFTPTATNNITTSDDGQIGALLFGVSSTAKSTNAHSSLSIRLLGDGATLATPDDGIYLLKMAISTTAIASATGARVGDSDPFYFVLTKNTSYAEALAAASSLGVLPDLIQGQVPEPTTLASLAGAAIGILARRRSRTIHRLGAVLAATVLSSPLVGFAHDGPRVWVAQRDGKLFTETSDDDYDPSAYTPAQVFTGELSQYFGTFTTQFPGYEAPRDGSGGIGQGTRIGFKIAGPLLTLSSDAGRLVPTAVRFAGASMVPQLAITFPDAPPSQAAAFTRRTAGGVVNGYDFTTTINEHVHLAYTLLGDGNSAATGGPDGVYVLPMVLTGSSLKTSSWYFLAFKKTSNDGALSSAAGLAQTMASARPGDTDFDGHVDFVDLVTLAQNYGTDSGAWWARGDFNFDGATNFDDLVALAQNYDQSSATLQTDRANALAIVPEPASASLVALLACRVRRRGAGSC